METFLTAAMPGPIGRGWLVVGSLLTFGLVFGSVGCEPPKTTSLNPTAVAGQPASPENPEEQTVEHPFSRRVDAPAFEGGLEWFNTSKPLKLAQLRGKFVLLDFWTYCCINCIHVLPELKKLERAYPNELVVIGVHSAKFEGEKISQNIREAVMRYEIEHPVVNDREMQIWNLYGIRSWPSMVLIDPEGKAVWIGSGEQKFEDLRDLLQKGLVYYRTQGLVDDSPISFELEAAKAAETSLRFPGKVLGDKAGNRLFIADSNHNRIVVTDLEGKLLEVIGSGKIGREDGPLETCSFHHPQGMTLLGSQLIVADTENHLLRKVDLLKRQVTTLAGTGKQGTGWPGLGKMARNAPGSLALMGRRFVGPPLATPLSSPWALWAGENDLYIAMAGPHQIWKMPLDESEIGPYAGNGREDIMDGPLLPGTPYARGYASFAQPSGLASDGTLLFVADSEGSAIRAVPLDAGGNVKTLVGPTKTLFDFGDTDGIGLNVRLQHPLGVAYHEGKIYVADTYNNKIKVIDIAAQSCQTFAGTGEAGNHDSAKGLQATFNEPAGLTVAGDKLYVADTNSHAIRVIGLSESHAVSTLVIEALNPGDFSEAK